MLDKFKQMAELKKMQSAMKKQKVELERDGVRVVINGTMVVEEIRLNPELDAIKQERLLRDLINDAIKQLQQSMMKDFMARR